MNDTTLNHLVHQVEAAVNSLQSSVRYLLPYYISMVHSPANPLFFLLRKVRSKFQSRSLFFPRTIPERWIEVGRCFCSSWYSIDTNFPSKTTGCINKHNSQNLTKLINADHQKDLLLAQPCSRLRERSQKESSSFEIPKNWSNCIAI